MLDHAHKRLVLIIASQDFKEGIRRVVPGIICVGGDQFPAIHGDQVRREDYVGFNLSPVT